MNRSLGRAAIAAASVLIAIAAVAPSAASAKVPPRAFYGVAPQTDLGPSDFARLGSGRVGTLRAIFLWGAVQNGRGDCTAAGGACDWTPIDNFVGAAANAGIEILPFFYGSAPFVHEDPRKPPLKKRDLKAWRDFVGAAVARYGTGGTYWQEGFPLSYATEAQEIHNWQVWNEPSAAAFWHDKPNARDYARLLKASAKAIRSADPGADVVLGGLFGTPTIPLRRYLSQLYRVNGIQSAFDEIAIHPYAKDLFGIKLQIGWARQVARRNRDRKVGIRISEMGWGSGRGGHPLNQGKKGQARMLNKSFGLLSRKRGAWNITGVNWFTYQDTNSKDVCRFCRDAGLFNVHGEPKPSWRAFKKFTR